jgi:hypothetical protein
MTGYSTGVMCLFLSLSFFFFLLTQNNVLWRYHVIQMNISQLKFYRYIVFQNMDVDFM